MKVLRSEVLAKLNEWTDADFDGCRGVWMEKHAAHIENWDDAPESFSDFCMTVAAQNVLFAKLELAGELA